VESSGYQAAHKRFGADAEYNEHERIKGEFVSHCAKQTLISRLDVFDSVSSTADLGVVPQENSTFGSVIETYDNLRRPDTKFVRGEITLRVQHCLLVRHGVKFESIRRIISHEQVSENLLDSTDNSDPLQRRWVSVRPS